MRIRTFFFHPDYTVGPGVSPDHAFRLAGCTAGRDSHPALKKCFSIDRWIIAREKESVKRGSA